jgi:hypothetical protein
MKAGEGGEVVKVVKAVKAVKAGRMVNIRTDERVRRSPR